MPKLSVACRKLVEQGLAVPLSGEAIRFTGKLDTDKLGQVERSYADAFHKRVAQRNAKVRTAERGLQDFVITY